MITFGSGNNSGTLEDTGVSKSTLFLWWTLRFFGSKLWLFLGEVRSICESVGSDGSSATVQAGASNQRPRMDIACVIDVSQSTNLAHRKRALEEVRLASDLVNANLHHIQVSTVFFYVVILWFILKFKVTSSAHYYQVVSHVYIGSSYFVECPGFIILFHKIYTLVQVNINHQLERLCRRCRSFPRFLVNH